MLEQSTSSPRRQAILPGVLVHVALKSQAGALAKAEERMRELRELARSAGVEVREEFVQLREQFDAKYFVGKGKLEEILARATELGAELLLFDGNISPSQASALAALTSCKILDRTQLVLDIFAQRAESPEGKLQVELAQLKYRLPRLGLKDDALSRLTGGIGGRGPGETKLEIGRRRAQERIDRLQKELKLLAKRRVQRRHKRVGSVFTVALIGYTNAGKSTLFRTLTGADVLVEDKLFATLDTRSRRVYQEAVGTLVLTDTVGFLRDLPKDLFAAFRATFDEAVDADLLVQVLDVSDPLWQERRKTTDTILASLELEHLPRVVALNKVDCLDEESCAALSEEMPNAVLLSACDPGSAKSLLGHIAERLLQGPA